MSLDLFPELKKEVVFKGDKVETPPPTKLKYWDNFKPNVIWALPSKENGIKDALDFIKYHGKEYKLSEEDTVINCDDSVYQSLIGSRMQVRIFDIRTGLYNLEIINYPS